MSKDNKFIGTVNKYGAIEKNNSVKVSIDIYANEYQNQGIEREIRFWNNQWIALHHFGLLNREWKM